MSILKKMGSLAAAAQQAYSATALSLSERIAELERAYKDYNHAIMYRDLPLYTSSNKCPQCGDCLMALTTEMETDIIIEFYLECANPKCSYMFEIWKMDN